MENQKNIVTVSEFRLPEGSPTSAKAKTVNVFVTYAMKLSPRVGEVFMRVAETATSNLDLIQREGNYLVPMA